MLPPHQYSRLSDGSLDLNHIRAWGSGITSDSTSFVLSLSLDGFRIIGIAKPGDECWTLVQFRNLLGTAPLMFLGRLYCLTENNLMVLEMRADRPPRMKVAAKLRKHICKMAGTAHLVDNGGELMVVYRILSRSHNSRYNVYRLDLDKKRLLPVKTLSQRALFLGMHNSFSVSTRVFPSICCDTIYFSFDLHERFDEHIEAYCLTDRSNKPANYILDNSSRRVVSSPQSVADCLSFCNTFRLYSSWLA